jgi:glycosyltransferase involved in cell wall biosynthesis
LETDRIKYKFLLLVPYSYPDYSGSGRNAFNFGKFLVKRGIPVKLVTFNRNSKYKKQEQIEGLNIYRISYLNKNQFLKIMSLLWILPIYFFRICSSDIIYIYGANLIAWQCIILFTMILGKKVIFRSLIFGEDDVTSLISSKNILNKAFHRYLIKHVDCYFSIHPGFSEEYVNVIGNNLKLLEIPQGIDTDRFYPVSHEEKKDIRKKLRLPEYNFIIVSIAFLIDRKGFDEIFEQLHYLKLPFQYLIIGENNFEEGHFLSNKQVEALRLRKKGIDLLGPKLCLAGPKENINEYIQVSDVCLFNSGAEGLPNSMLEAMACGIPIISNPITGLEGYLLHHQENSMIFSQPGDLNKIIELLYNDPDLRESLGIKAIETIGRIGTFDIVLRRILNKLKLE